MENPTNHETVKDILSVHVRVVFSYTEDKCFYFLSSWLKHSFKRLTKWDFKLLWEKLLTKNPTEINVHLFHSFNTETFLDIYAHSRSLLEASGIERYKNTLGQYKAIIQSP